MGVTTTYLEVDSLLPKLQGQVVFQRVGSSLVPDFVFGEDFVPLRLLDSKAAGIAQLLDEWDNADIGRLHRLVVGILHKYTDWQLERVRRFCTGNSRLQFEVDTLPRNEPGTQGMLSTLPDGLPSKVILVLPLQDVDLGPVEPLLARMHVGQAAAPAAALAQLKRQFRLRVAFPAGGAGEGGPEVFVYLPQEVFDIVGKPKLPSWTTGMCLMEYRPAVLEAVQAHIAGASAGAALRQGLLSALADSLGWPLELDAVAYRTALFKSATDSVPFLVQFDLPATFPEDKPRISIRTAAGQEVGTLSRPPWSPRWSAKEMALRLSAALAAEATKLRDRLHTDFC